MKLELELGNIKNLKITQNDRYILINGIIPGGSISTEFETMISPDGEIVTRHCGVGPGFIWTNWQEGYLRGE
jgi:hypothetical protein